MKMTKLPHQQIGSDLGTIDRTPTDDGEENDGLWVEINKSS